MTLRYLLGALRRFARDQSGQGMAEYATITFFLAAPVGAGVIAFVLPQLLNALNTYLNSLYYILNLPLP